MRKFLNKKGMFKFTKPQLTVVPLLLPKIIQISTRVDGISHQPFYV